MQLPCVSLRSHLRAGVREPPWGLGNERASGDGRSEPGGWTVGRRGRASRSGDPKDARSLPACRATGWSRTGAGIATAAAVVRCRATLSGWCQRLRAARKSFCACTASKSMPASASAVFRARMKIVCASSTREALTKLRTASWSAAPLSPLWISARASTYGSSLTASRVSSPALESSSSVVPSVLSPSTVLRCRGCDA